MHLTLNKKNAIRETDEDEKDEDYEETTEDLMGNTS